jgi:hypothetical protein
MESEAAVGLAEAFDAAISIPDPMLAFGSGTAYNPSILVREGYRVGTRSGMGGFPRITTTTVQWIEVGDPMPGQPIYDTAVPFTPLNTSQQTAITITGGRTYTHDVTVSLAGGPTNITGATFLSQIRTSRNGVGIAQFQWEIIDAPNGKVRLWLSPIQTRAAAQASEIGVWDLEMRIGGREYTVIPESPVTLRLGVSQGDYLYPSLAYAIGEAFNAALEVA